MRVTADLVIAAQHGDRRSLEALMSASLPFVHAIVARAVDSPDDADDVVQDTMLRAVRDLPGLRSPESFRPWLAAIAVRQVGTLQSRRESARARSAPLDEVAGAPDPAADVEGLAVLRTRITGQRREVAEAARWLDPDDRTLLSLWWQETAGLMTRGEVAEAIGLNPAHTGVRIQRMREQLDLARSVTAALRADPRCPDLTAAAAGWDGAPGPLWRKRLARHVRSCPICTAAEPERVPVERLLGSVPALAVPPGLIEAVLAKGSAATLAKGAAVTTKGGLLGALSAHPVAAAIAGVTAAAAVVVPVVRGDDSLATTTIPQVTAAPPARVTPARTPAYSAAASSAAPASEAPASTAPASTAPASTAPARPGTVGRGRVSLAWTGGGYVTARETTTATIQATRTDQQIFEAVDGLADPGCVSFRTLDGRYLRHYELLIYTHSAQDTAIFREDATYCPEPGTTAGSVMLRSHNYPDFCLRWTGAEFRIGFDDGSAKFRADSSFVVGEPAGR
ncbi:sigma-70 family RNA polymerase sigma factor [Actinoplanes sp. NPDC023714]|uniref:sigma-70 family RNA polymerase sigma factor n=1 Tax=Actinoplanes sp. NPDC023714 TaxID=3154322 RepID=UPI0033DFB8F2